jgi:hypothetical protein
MNITQLLGALGAQRYLFVFVLLAAYARRLTAADSKFPITLPDAWRPVVTTLFGLVYGVLAAAQGGASWESATLGGVISAATGGFADMLLVAIFSNSAAAPAWARALAFIFDDFKGDASASGGGPVSPSNSSPAGNPPTLRRAIMVATAPIARALVVVRSNRWPSRARDLAADCGVRQ